MRTGKPSLIYGSAMINIVSGIQNAGKTRFMRDHASGSGGDGILSLKYFEKGRHTGYDLLHVQSGAVCPLIRHRDHLPAHWDALAEKDPWFFSAAAFRFAQEKLQNNPSETLYLDEIGPLEIQNKAGFYSLATALIAVGKKELFFSVRESLLEAFMETFSLTRSQILIIHLTSIRGSYD